MIRENLYFQKDNLIIRKMEKSDENSFVDLLTSVYGHTYSYKSLYMPGGYSRLISSSNSICFGMFREDGLMIGHTGIFFKDPNYDYAESGMSMRRIAKLGVDRALEAYAWKEIIAWLSQYVTYLHQNTTTSHQFAQLYAEAMLQAIPTGLVVNYAEDEQLVGFNSLPSSMHALSQTSILRSNIKPQTVQIADSIWSTWLCECFRNVNMEMRIVPSRSKSWSLEDIEINSAINLRRRKVGNGEPCHPSHGKARTDLLHLPCDGRSINTFINLGYLPVGVRPHVSRLSEIILQYLPIELRCEVSDSLQKAKIITKKGKNLVSHWVSLCTQTM